MERLSFLFSVVLPFRLCLEVVGSREQMVMVGRAGHDDGLITDVLLYTAAITF